METHRAFPTSREISMDDVETHFPLNGNLSQRAESSRFPESVTSATPDSNRINPLAAELNQSSAAQLPVKVSDSSNETAGALINTSAESDSVKMPTTTIAATLIPDSEGTREVNPSTPNCFSEEDDLLKSSLEGPAENNYIDLTNCLTSNIKESDFVLKAESIPVETIPMA